MNTPLNSIHSTSKLSCLCSPAQSQQASGSTRRGFLSSLLATGTAAGLSASMAGCQTFDNVFGAATPAKSSRIDIHHHIVPPSYAEDLKRMGVGGVPRWTPQMSIDDMDKNDIRTSVVALIQPGAFFKKMQQLTFEWPDSPTNTPLKCRAIFQVVLALSQHCH